MPLSIYTVMLMAILMTQSCKVNQGLNNTSDSEESYSDSQVKQDTNEKTYPIAEYTTQHKLENYSTAIFAGGCFWCTEAVFERINGVKDVLSGYSGGHVAFPSYSAVGAGKTGHTEAIYIYYDDEVVSYETLLDVLFIAAHDPTTLNRQGPDAGEEYRSAIYYGNEEEKTIIAKKIKEIDASDLYADKIVTEVAPYEEFWVAEGYHQNYYELHPNHSYVSRVSRPKVNKVLKRFPDLIKPAYK